MDESPNMLPDRTEAVDIDLIEVKEEEEILIKMISARKQYLRARVKSYSDQD